MSPSAVSAAGVLIETYLFCLLIRTCELINFGQGTDVRPAHNTVEPASVTLRIFDQTNDLQFFSEMAYLGDKQLLAICTWRKAQTQVSCEAAQHIIYVWTGFHLVVMHLAVLFRSVASSLIFSRESGGNF